LGKSNGEKERGAEEGRSIKDKSEAREDAEAFGEKEKGEGERRHAEEGRSIIDKSIKYKSKK
jgi:hypothetical protein